MQLISDEVCRNNNYHHIILDTQVCVYCTCAESQGVFRVNYSKVNDLFILNPAVSFHASHSTGSSTVLPY